ncbi:MAG TPA: carbohydrate kinase family protein [Bacilli bacterium]
MSSIPNDDSDCKDIDVLCAGILVADLFTDPLDKLLLPGELALVDNISLETGGCAINTGVNLSKLGAKVVLAGKVGNDFFGSAIKQDMQNKGLDIQGVGTAINCPTSKTLVVIVKGEDRRYIHSIGANAEFTVRDIDYSLVKRAKVVYVGGLLAMPGLDPSQLVPLFQYAQEVKTKTILDVVVPSGAYIPEGLQALLPYVDVFLPNDDEALAISGLHDPLEQANWFAQMGAGTVIITRGSKGSVVQMGSRKFRIGTYPIKLVDSSGGGDAFSSGFIFGELKGWGLQKKLELASALGASACMSRGCTNGTFTLSEALEFIENYELAVEEIFAVL